MRKYRRQEPPFSVTLELAEGCNLYCTFCALSGIRTQKEKNYKFMDLSTIESVAKQMAKLGWNARMGFAMHGEPTMHPDYVGAVATLQQHRPRNFKTMLTNAGGLLRRPGPVANIKALFDAGLNVLSLDDYEGANLVPKVIAELEQVSPLVSGQLNSAGFTFYRYPEDLKGNPHVRRPINTHTLVQIRDIEAQHNDKKIGTHGKLFNFAGVGFAPNDSMAGKRCAQPFRQLAIRWDGNVAICCNDWRGEYQCGNVVTDGVEAVWQGAALGAAREMMIRGRREFSPCRGCDHRSYRVGLLPDLKGQGKLHAPDQQTAKDIITALKKGPLTAPVLRAWEKAKAEAAE